MNKAEVLKKFLEMNHISSEIWEKAHIDWETLAAIAEDHQKQSAHLEDAAELIAKRIQKCSAVHSVRWRVKDASHLLEKIVRKRADKNTKYAEITADNYFEIVTDLIGVRALHLFKTDCFVVDETIRDAWTLHENPVAYIRDGDSESLREQFRSTGFEVKEHPAGYRSVHYVTRSTPMKREVIAEIQVRTIFEEGWSEIDHSVRYPNFSDNKLVEYFLQIFNRLAGSADDMGGFVLGLVADLKDFENKILSAEKEKYSILEQMDKHLSELQQVKEQDKAARENVLRLKEEVSKLKAENGRLDLLKRGLRTTTTGLNDSQAINIIRNGLFDLEAVEQAKRRIGLRGRYETDVDTERKKIQDLMKPHITTESLLEAIRKPNSKPPKK